MTRERLMQLRRLIVRAAKSLSDADAFGGKELFDFWTVDTAYAVGDRRRYGEELYKCLTAHTSQSTWTPPDSPSLWVAGMGTADGRHGRLPDGREGLSQRQALDKRLRQQRMGAGRLRLA